MDETQNDASFVAFYDMRAVTFVPADEMADVTIAGLQWFILTKIHLKLSPSIVLVALLIVNIYSEFQICTVMAEIMTKCQSFCMTTQTPGLQQYLVFPGKQPI